MLEILNDHDFENFRKLIYDESGITFSATNRSILDSRIKELLRLTQGSVVALDGLAGEPLDILINGYLIAQGEVVVVADKYGVRITDIITPSERMRRLSR